MLAKALICHCKCITNKASYLGPYINRLVKGMGLWHHLPQIQVQCVMEHLTLQILRKMKLLVPYGNKLVVVGVEDEEDEEEG